MYVQVFHSVWSVMMAILCRMDYVSPALQNVTNAQLLPLTASLVFLDSISLMEMDIVFHAQLTVPIVRTHRLA